MTEGQVVSSKEEILARTAPQGGNIAKFPAIEGDNQFYVKKVEYVKDHESEYEGKKSIHDQWRVFCESVDEFAGEGKDGEEVMMPVLCTIFLTHSFHKNAKLGKFIKDVNKTVFKEIGGVLNKRGYYEFDSAQVVDFMLSLEGNLLELETSISDKGYTKFESATGVLDSEGQPVKYGSKDQTETTPDDDEFFS